MLLPAPFSPRRAWISPGSTTRSMWSLATRGPNTLVMPRSSSFIAWCLRVVGGGSGRWATPQRPDPGGRAAARPRVAAAGPARRSSPGHCGAFGVSMVSSPEMICSS
ncbi:hypothetical protein [Ornithinimicrobium kibberense]|uniref:hypothetical protein n=1 Tax=Ornithinimicrobium kibberense TaxID=282060 RepID=UPI0036090759